MELDNMKYIDNPPNAETGEKYYDYYEDDEDSEGTVPPLKIPKRWLPRVLFFARTPHEKYVSKRIFRSVAAIQKEIRRQMEENSLIIHPFSSFKWFWDMIMVVCMTVTMVVQPVYAAYFYDDPDGPTFLEAIEGADHFQRFNVVIDCVFMFDILVNFRSGYVDIEASKVVLDSKAIAVRYSRTWFVIDFVSSFPFDYVVESLIDINIDTVTSEQVEVIAISLKIARVFGLMRVLRVVRVMRYIGAIESILQIEGPVVNICHLLFLAALYCHWTACLHFIIALLSDFPETSWVSKSSLIHHNVTIINKYSLSVYRAVSNMLALDMTFDGGVSAGTPLGEVWFSIISYMVGGIFYAMFIANVSDYVLLVNLAGKLYDQKVAEATEYMKFRRVPVEIQQRVLQFYRHKYQSKYFNERSILYDPNMAPVLRHELISFNCRGLLLKVPFLRNAPATFHFEIICKLAFQIFFPGDVIIQAGRRGNEMYFIEHGMVEICLPDGTAVKQLRDGDIFGEIALLQDTRRTASVIARETCDVYVLRKKDFNEVLNDHPDMRAILEEEAKTRVVAMADTAAKDINKE